jgi:hypothetical protein
VAWFEGIEDPVLLRKFDLILLTEGHAAIDAKLDALKDSVEKMTGENATELRQTKKALGKAQEAASMNLKEALFQR